MKKSVISIITILLISAIVISNFMPGVQAIGIGNPYDYIQTDKDNSAIVPIGKIIVGIVRTVGISLSFLILTIIGVKYIMGSVQEKAEYKQTMWPYIIGAILIFSGSQITQIIYDAITKAN